MKTRKILFYAIAVIGIIFLFSNNAFAIEEGSSWYAKLGSSMVDSLSTMILRFITVAISILIGFMAGLMTFGILFLTYLMDVVFIKVPYIGDILGAEGDIVFVHNVQMITTIVLVFSIALWLVLGGTTYIKSVFEKITMGEQGGSKFNIFKDIISKFVVVILIFSIPFSLPTIFKGINGISSGILKLEISSFSKEDQIIIASKPLTSLVELGLGLPSVDGMSSDYKNNENKVFTSIHDQKEGEGVSDGVLQFNTIFKSIIDKSMFQYGRFVNLAMTISEKETINNILENDSDSTAVNMQSMADGYSEGLVIFLFITIFYIVMLYTIFMKLFALFMILVTRFVKVIMGSIFIPFHIAMLGSESTKSLGQRNLMSYTGDLLVTPLIAAFTGIAILVLGYFASVIGVGGDGFLYFATGSDLDSYESVLFNGMLILAFLYGILNELTKQIEKIGANFENLFAKNGQGGGAQDSYGSPGEAMNAAGKVWGFGQKIGTALGAGKAATMVGGLAMSKVGLDPMLKRAKDDAKFDGVKQANIAKLNKITSKHAGNGNNTKIN